MTFYSAKEIKDSYIQKKDWEKQFPISYFIFRPISFYLASFISNFTNSAPLIAAFGFVLGISGSICLIYLAKTTIWPGIILLIACALSDAIDGNMARVTNTVTYYGKFLDGILGVIAEGLYIPALSLGLYFDTSNKYIFFQNNGLDIYILLSGFISLILLLYSSKIETTYDFHKNHIDNEKGIFNPDIKANIKRSRFRRNIFFFLFLNFHAFNFQLILLVIFSFFKLVDIFLFGLTAYYAGRFLIITIYNFKRANKTLI